MGSGREWAPGLQPHPDLPQPHQQHLPGGGPEDAARPTGKVRSSLCRALVRGVSFPGSFAILVVAKWAQPGCGCPVATTAWAWSLPVTWQISGIGGWIEIGGGGEDLPWIEFKVFPSILCSQHLI